jgi:SAM-dependent methyltransferase
MITVLENCRLCESEFYNKSLKLIDTPLANELYKSKDLAKKADRFPLELVMCESCRHVQLRHIVDPKRLFDNYVYKSGTSSFFRKHFKDLANSIAIKYKEKNGYVLEVGSNDGILLDELTSHGIRCIGVEPSSNLVAECNNRNLEVFEAYFDDKFTDFLLMKYGKASLVLGNNVFAHIQELKRAFENVYKILDSDGVFIFEVAHLKNILTDGIFDTIYHEHMSYHSAYSMEKFANSAGFKLFDIEKISPHGGSLRFFLTKNLGENVTSSVEKIIQEEIELGLNNEKVLTKIGDNIVRIKAESQKLTDYLMKNQHSKLIGYGAPAKVVTFLAQVELEEIEIVGIIEDNKHKQEKYLPGSGIRIMSMEIMNKSMTENFNSDNDLVACLIFPWNLKVEIISKLADLLPKGSKVVTFFPDVEMVAI